MVLDHLLALILMAAVVAQAVEAQAEVGAEVVAVEAAGVAMTIGRVRLSPLMLVIKKGESDKVNARSPRLAP